MLSHEQAQELHRLIGGVMMDMYAMSPTATAEALSSEMENSLDRALELAALLVADTMPEEEPRSPTGTLDPPIPVTEYRFGIAGGAKYALVCKHHPENHYRSKNPWTRSIFVVHPEHDCPCPLADLLVTWAPDDAHDD
jgi:hypothetical protein